MPRVIKLIWNGIVWRRYPDNPLRNHRVYFTGWHGGIKTSLHRAKWNHHHGPIPKGHEISHKSGNPLDNSIGNLQCLTPAEHRQHDHKLGAYDTEAMRKHLHREHPEAKVALSRWIKENPEQHRVNSALAFSKTAKKDLVCKQCGVEYQNNRPWSMYCSKKCKADANPFQPKHPFKCGTCKKLGLSKSKRIRFCSNSCAALERERLKRLAK